MAECAKCQQPPEVEINHESDSDTEMEASSATQTIPDDVKLSCNCHFHWECLLDSYELGTCPSCSSSIITSPPTSSSSGATASQQDQILVDLNNEGGLQEQIDIMPLLREESYLRAYPEERKCRAFLEFCREGDHRAIVDLLKSCTEPVGAEDIDIDELDEQISVPNNKNPDEILRYQDPIGDMQSGLHVAAANGNREVAWLLLLLASQFSESDIPALVFQEAAALNIMRAFQEGKVDIRSLRDAHDQTAEDIAKEAGVIWNGWIGNGRLAMPES